MPLFLQAQIAAILFSRSYAFEADRPGGDQATVATHPAFALDLGLGLGVKIF